MENLMLNNLIDKLENELAEVAHKETWNAADLDEIEELTCSIEKLLKIEKMQGKEDGATTWSASGSYQLGDYKAREAITKRLGDKTITAVDRSALERVLDLME